MNMSYSWDILNDPFFIGFDKMVKKIPTATSTATAFPPYNLIKIDDDNYIVELAVAGFSREDISIEDHDGVLTIKGEKKHDNDVNYLHRGIAGRKFTRMFSLSEYMEVASAQLVDGILNVYLWRNVPEERRPKSITID